MVDVQKFVKQETIDIDDNDVKPNIQELNKKVTLVPIEHNSIKTENNVEQSVPQSSETKEIKPSSSGDTPTCVANLNNATDPKLSAAPSDPDVDADLENPEIQEILRNGNGVMYSCNICRESLATLKDFNIHSNAHNSSDKPSYTKFYTCGECMYACKKPQSLLSHNALQHVNKKYMCDVCSYTTNRPCILKSHKLSHSSEKPFACQECNFKTNQEKYLKYHQKKHIDGNEHRCHVCDKTFLHSNYLTLHMQSHQMTKNYPCSSCEFSCLSARDLRNHMEEKHLNGKVLECIKCKFKCLFPREMKEHQMSHGPTILTCTFCLYRCKKRSTMDKHLSKHKVADKQLL